MSNPYSTDKVLYHPELVQALAQQRTHEGYPVFVHLMPDNRCNQNCSFCSFRMDNWKNSKQFNTKASIPWERMKALIQEFKEVGVKAVEITGGGEPTLYPNFMGLVRGLFPIKRALVTNGMRLTSEWCEELPAHLTWMRVSIDAGQAGTYYEIRKTRAWDHVWNNVAELVKYKGKMTLGLGFVITKSNWSELPLFLRKAAKYGVDNVRISVAFTPEGKDILTSTQVDSLTQWIERAKDDFSELQIADHHRERIKNMEEHPDYDYCCVKDLICVIEGTCNVYTCCSLTGTPEGLVGNITEIPFGQLWESRSEWRKKFPVKVRCQCPCLYNKRNRTMLGLRNPPDHLEFI